MGPLERLTATKDWFNHADRNTNHEGRIERLEGIIEQIDKRLSRIETVVIGQLIMTVAILIKLFIS